ncbi:MAG: hypothetical protein QOH56_3650 [Pseudonocardiales bacterium]|nr:hypothetical protein [Pseudonocardiales bacterium]
MSISDDHPFLPPEAERSPIRRLRGRLASPVTLWTSGDAGGRAGLTVSSMLIADGEPGYVLGVIDPLSDLWDQLRHSRAGVVTVLGWEHRRLADIFGYVAPAPGGPFAADEWIDTEWGPVLAAATTWAGCRLSGEEPRTLGWGVQVSLQVEHTEFADDSAPLVHRRGRYYRL